MRSKAKIISDRNPRTAQAGVGPQGGTQRSAPDAEGPHRAPANFPAWQRRRAGLLHRLFLRVEHRRNTGESFRQALRDFEWRWRDRTFDGQHRARFAYQTLRSNYYQWRASGKSPSGVYLNYSAARSSLAPALIQEFRNICLTPGTKSIAHAYRRLVERWRTGETIPGLGNWQTWAEKQNRRCRRAPAFPISRSQFYRALPADMAAVMKELHSSMIQIARLNSRINQLLRFD